MAQDFPGDPWFELRASTTEGMGLILDQGTKVAQMEQCSQRQKKVKLQNNKSIILLNKLKFMGKIFKLYADKN